MARSTSRKFLVDGFPRNMDNLSVWNEVRVLRVCRWLMQAGMADPPALPCRALTPTQPAPPRPRHTTHDAQEMEHIAEAKLMLFLDCPEAVMETRMLGRGRSDDIVGTIKKRCATCKDKTAAAGRLAGRPAPIPSPLTSPPL